MNRLVYGPGAFFRKLQISECEVFAFVEGGLDRPFSERLLQQKISKTGLRFQVIAAKELPGATGGKPRLLKLYAELKEKGLLKYEGFRKKAVCAIFLDKDVDDLSKFFLRCPHVIYTSNYDLEGDLITCGDLLRATADGCGLTIAQARSILGDPQQWIKRHSQNWIDWTTLCVISQLHQVNPGCTFSRNSGVNLELIGAVDEKSLVTYKAKLRAALKLTGAAFDKVYEKQKSLIQKEIATEQPLKSFRGKWLLTILEKEIVKKNTAPDAHLQAIGQIIPALLVGQVGNQQECACCKKHEATLEKLVEEMV